MWAVILNLKKQIHGQDSMLLLPGFDTLKLMVLTKIISGSEIGWSLLLD